MLGRKSNAVGCESKRLFSVLSQMYQSCVYILDHIGIEDPEAVSEC